MSTFARMPAPMSVPSSSTLRQRGGTVAGLLIGLIIGLVIAVWVAMTIMKTPLPFVDRIGKQAQPTGDLGDPNKSLPGRTRERREPEADAAAAPAKAMPAPSDAAHDGAHDAASAAPHVPTGSATSAAPAGSVAPVAPAPPAAAPTAPAAKGGAAADANVAPSANGEAYTYYLQAGAFREQQDAEATKARLALMGVAASISERKSELGSLYRVRVGPFADVESMNRARARLSDNGVDVAVVRVPK